MKYPPVLLQAPFLLLVGSGMASDWRLEVCSLICGKVRSSLRQMGYFGNKLMLWTVFLPLLFCSLKWATELEIHMTVSTARHCETEGEEDLGEPSLIRNGSQKASLQLEAVQNLGAVRVPAPDSSGIEPCLRSCAWTHRLRISDAQESWQGGGAVCTATPSCLCCAVLSPAHPRSLLCLLFLLFDRYVWSLCVPLKDPRFTGPFNYLETLL